MRTLLFLVLTVGTSMIVAVAGQYVVSLVVPLDVLKANNDVAGNYLQTLGTVFAVLLAFVVFVVWTQFNETERLVAREANELADIYRIARALSNPVQSQVVGALRDYGHEVVQGEWSNLARGKTSLRAGQLLEAIWVALVRMEPATAREEALYAEAVARFNELSDTRTDRLHSSRTRLPVTLWILLVTGAVVTVTSMYLFGLEGFWSLAFMTAAMAGEVSFVLFLIQDLDSPFTGDWQVTADPILLVLERIDTETGGPSV